MHKVAETRVLRRARSLEWAAVAAVLAAAAALRFWRIGARSLWFDEGFSLGMSQLGRQDFLRVTFEREANMPLYYLLLKAWLWFGNSEVWIRGLSAACGVATVAALYLLAHRLFGGRVAIIAALLASLNAFLIKYSQEARSYALVTLLAVLATLLLARALETGRRRDWVLYVLFSTAAAYSHLFAALVIAAHALSLIVASPKPGAGRQWFEALRWTAYLSVPIIAAARYAGGAAIMWLERPSAAGILRGFEVLAGNGGIVLLLALSLAAALGARAALRERRLARRMKSWAYVLALAWAVMPLFTVLVVSLFRPVFLPRYLIVCLPGWLLLAAIGIAELRPAALRVTFAIVLAALSLRGTLAYYVQDLEPGQDWRGAVGYLLREAHPGDAAAFYGTPGWIPYRYYAERLGGQSSPEIILPLERDWRGFLVPPLAEVLPRTPTDRPRVWLFIGRHNNDLGSRTVRAWFAKNYRLVQTTEFEGITLLLYEKQI